MSEQRVAPRFGSVYDNRKAFEDAVFAFVRGDPHIYMKKGCTESEHRILCHRASASVGAVVGGIKCPAIYRIVKRDPWTEGLGWRCVEAEIYHSDRCTAQRRAELAKANEERERAALQQAGHGQSQQQQQQGEEGATDAYTNGRTVLPTPPISADPSANSLSLSPSDRIESPAKTAQRPTASGLLRGQKLSLNSQEFSLTAMSQLLPSSQTRQPESHLDISAELVAAGTSGPDRAMQRHVVQSSGSRSQAMSLSPDDKIVQPRESLPSATIDEVQVGFH